MPKKAKSKPKPLEPLAPVRELTGTPCASCKADPDKAAQMVAHGWHAVGTSGQQYIMIADEEAVASYMAAQGGADEKSK